MILKLQVQLKPCVLNNPNDPKHATIPSNTFMPGKDGTAPRDISSLYGLVGILHRQHLDTFADLPPRDGFVLGATSHLNDEPQPQDYHIPLRSTIDLHSEQMADVRMQESDRPVGELPPSRSHVPRIDVSHIANVQFLASTGLSHQPAPAPESFPSVAHEKRQDQAQKPQI